MASGQFDEGERAQDFVAVPVAAAREWNVFEILQGRSRGGHDGGGGSDGGGGAAHHLVARHPGVWVLWAASVCVREAVLAFVASEGFLARVQPLMGSQLARLDKGLVATGMGAPVWTLAGVYPLVGLERFFARKRSLTKSTPDGTLRVGSLLN